MNAGKSAIWLSYLLVFALTLTVGSVAASAPADGTTVSGRILDLQGGLPVPNATIELRRGSQTAATAITDRNGNFKIPNQSAGSYAVFITAAGYGVTRFLPDLLVGSD
ncbi:MAG: carboxypeptidase-like regulatory domain-containing protein, partial [Candidatus Cybelea sp.]